MSRGGKMSNAIPAQKTVPDISELKAKLKYLHFSTNLWRVRERRGIRSRQMAEFLGMKLVEYKKIEGGEVLPDRKTLTKLAKVLEIEPRRIINWINFAKAKLKDETPQEGALKYIDEWNSALSSFKKHYQSSYSQGEEVHEDVLNVLTTLKKDSCRVIHLPILPMSLYMILDALFDDRNRKYTYLNEVQSFLVENENLAAYIARDPYLGPFTFYAANLTCFASSPSMGILDCLNRLTLKEFSDILYSAIATNGIYTNYENLTYLQQYHEFNSLGAIMVRELKDVLPKEINFENLYMATLMQGLGTYAFFTTLEPAYHEDHSQRSNNSEVYEELDDTIMNMINYEFHPVVSGMIAANWNMPEEVIQTIFEHHDRPESEVSPICSALKLVNFFVDCDFPTMSEDELEELMEMKHPQLNIPVHEIFKIANKMNKMSQNLAEMSSQIIETKVKEVEAVTSKKIKEFKRDFAINAKKQEMICHKPPKRSEIRFHPEYGKVLSIQCQYLFNTFMNEKLTPLKGEHLTDYSERLQALQVQDHYLVSKDISNTAERFGVSLEDIKSKLKL